MDFTVPPEIEQLCAGVRRFMDEHVYPLERGFAWRLEADGPAYPPPIRAVQERAKALGYWAFHLPREAGGAGIPFMHYVLVIDTGGAAAAREEIALIKFFGARVLHDVVDRAIQVHGAAGVSEDHPLSHFYRQARLARIYDGPDEVHKMVVARRLLAQYGDARSGAR
jgi:alkylation response protein AidB-like acyl-CoA dehydrogenase